MTQSIRNAYLQLLNESETASSSEGVVISQTLVSKLNDLSDQLGQIVDDAINAADSPTARSASALRLRVSFMIAHINQEIIRLIDESDELAAAQAVLFDANKGLAKIKADTANLGKKLETAAAILGEFEKLVKWVKAH